MIVRMKHLDLICVASEKERTLEELRALGAVHLDLAGSNGVEVVQMRGELAEAEKAVRLILKARGKDRDCEVRPHTVADVLAIDSDHATLKTEAERLTREIKIYEPYGDFDPVLAQKLLNRGIDLADRLPTKLPEMRLSRLREKLARVENRMAIDQAKLAQSDEQAIIKQYPTLRDRLAFAAAKETMAEKGPVAVISGWLPEPQIPTLMKRVSTAYDKDLFEKMSKPGWGVLLRDPEAGETPPTLIEPPKFFKSVSALFSGLGIAPGYFESDVSVPFMCYFSLFFAMLVGDGGYGAIFLGVTLWMWHKVGRNAWTVLLTVFSSATIVWGLLSNTWFGAGLPCCANWPTVTWLADPSYAHMMLLCFTIGVSHLMLARIWSGVQILNDRACLAQFGWAGILLFMYLVTNAIVGIFPCVPQWGYWVFGISLVLVFGFTLKGSELKSRGIELGMLPLNIMSALGDIISYVRLFAVGLASVKVAENFNGMATGLVAGADGWALKAVFSVAMVAILLVGHGLNLAMAGLSILVHAVRLNTLEFSNHKGISWAGYAFQPFKKTKE